MSIEGGEARAGANDVAGSTLDLISGVIVEGLMTSVNTVGLSMISGNGSPFSSSQLACSSVFLFELLMASINY